MARILLADDDTANLDLVRRALAGDGHDVTTAADGSEALDLLDRPPGEIALLVADIDMPGLDGISLAERARAADPALRVLLMSGFTDQIYRARTLEGPLVRTLSKPFTLDLMRSTVRGLLA